MRSPLTKARGPLVASAVKPRHSFKDRCLAVVAGAARLTGTSEKTAARRHAYKMLIFRTAVFGRTPLSRSRNLITQKFIQFRPGLHLPENIFLSPFRAKSSINLQCRSVHCAESRKW